MKKSIVLFLAAVLLLMTACSKEPESVGTHDENHQGGDAGKDEGSVEDLGYTYPLTGLAKEEKSSERAVGVMVNNHPKARQQTGLTDADIVYEVLAEGEITRFLAIYQSKAPQMIGPVRSARDYYIELAKGYDGLFIAHGFSPEAKKLLTEGYVDNLNGMQYDGTLFQRSAERQAPHNSYISYSSILKGAKQNNFEMDVPPNPLAFLNEEELNQIQGEEANKISIYYGSNPQYNSLFYYDKDTEKYIRYSNGEKTVDYESGMPVAVSNVFILEAEHHTADSKGRRDIDLQSGGNGYLLQKGKWNKVEWKNIDGRLLPFDGDRQIGLVPGKTWINIIPSDPGLDAADSLETQ